MPSTLLRSVCACAMIASRLNASTELSKPSIEVGAGLPVSARNSMERSIICSPSRGREKRRDCAGGPYTTRELVQPCERGVDTLRRCGCTCTDHVTSHFQVHVRR